MAPEEKNRLYTKVLKAFQAEIPCAMVSSYREDPLEINKKKWRAIWARLGGSSVRRMVYVSVYDPRYTRTESLQNLFRLCEQEVTYKFFRGRFRYLKLLTFVLLHRHRFDVIFVSFRAQEILPLIRICWGKKPLIFDAFVSAYDTLCLERGKIDPASLLGKALKYYDTFLCRISTLVLVDTQAHKQYFETEFGCDNVDFLYVDCNRDLFFPGKPSPASDIFEILWYGGGQPIHGVDTILRVARQLRDERQIHFTLAGRIKNVDLPSNVTHLPWIEYTDLPEKIRSSDLCLGGHFSKNIAKGDHVIAGKTFQCVACGANTIVKDNPANAELFDFS